MDIIQKLAAEFKIKTSQVQHTVELIDEGNTIPFIARYRKEATGGLTDVILRDMDERLKYLRNLEERKEEVIRLIEEQGESRTFINRLSRRKPQEHPRPRKKALNRWR